MRRDGERLDLALSLADRLEDIGNTVFGGILPSKDEPQTTATGALNVTVWWAPSASSNSGLRVTRRPSSVTRA